MFEDVVNIGQYNGHNVFYDGIEYYIKINGKRFAIDLSQLDIDSEKFNIVLM